MAAVGLAALTPQKASALWPDHSSGYYYPQTSYYSYYNTPYVASSYYATPYTAGYVTTSSYVTTAAYTPTRDYASGYQTPPRSPRLRPMAPVYTYPTYTSYTPVYNSYYYGRPRFSSGNEVDLAERGRLCSAILPDTICNHAARDALASPSATTLARSNARRRKTRFTHSNSWKMRRISVFSENIVQREYGSAGVDAYHVPTNPVAVAVDIAKPVTAQRARPSRRARCIWSRMRSGWWPIEPSVAVRCAVPSSASAGA